jgi:hypothetical protein
MQLKPVRAYLTISNVSFDACGFLCSCTPQV